MRNAGLCGGQKCGAGHYVLSQSIAVAGTGTRMLFGSLQGGQTSGWAGAGQGSVGWAAHWGGQWDGGLGSTLGRAEGRLLRCCTRLHALACYLCKCCWPYKPAGYCCQRMHFALLHAPHLRHALCNCNLHCCPAQLQGSALLQHRGHASPLSSACSCSPHAPLLRCQDGHHGGVVVSGMSLLLGCSTISELADRMRAQVSMGMGLLWNGRGCMACAGSGSWLWGYATHAAALICCNI